MPAIDVENAWGLDATSLGNHEFDYGVDRLKQHIARANFPFLATNVVETATGEAPSCLRRSTVFIVNGIQVGVIGAELRRRPSWSRAGATAGPDVPGRGGAHQGGVASASSGGVKVQVVVIHEGTAGANPIGNAAGVPWDGPDPRRSPTRSGHDGRRDGRGPHPPDLEHCASAHIPIAEGINAGASYSVAAADGHGGRRRLGRRRDARREGHRRRRAGRRQGDRRQGERRHGAAAQPA